MRSKVFQRIIDNTPEEVNIFVDWYTDIVIRINQILREKGISQKELAEGMNKNSSEISKWLSGEHNFTLRSLAKLSAQLGEPLLEVPKKKQHSVFVSGYSRSVQTFVIYKRVEPTKQSNIIKWQQAKEKNSYSNVG